jgi:N utilization substance protein A
VELNELERTVTVVVPDRQLSLAIGREGQNARLAARLTGWRIDIKSATAAEVEKAEGSVLAQGHDAPTDVEGGVEPAVVPEAPEIEQEPLAGEVAEDVPVEALTETAELSAVPEIPPLDSSELEALLAESKGALDKEEDGEATPLEVALSAPDLFTPPKARQGTEEMNQIRFAEEVLVPRPGRSKKGKKTKEKETDSKEKKAKRIKETYLETESEAEPEAGPEAEPESGNENGET